MCTVPISLQQLLGCYSENPSCPEDDSTCHVDNFVRGMTDAKHELSECATACRLADNLYFAKTVSTICFTGAKALAIHARNLGYRVNAGMSYSAARHEL